MVGSSEGRKVGGNGVPGPGGWVDLHNHVIPGVDDGARDASEADAAVAALRAQGVERVVATPHVDGSLTTDPHRLARRLEDLDEGWDLLQEREETAAGVDRGAEVKLDVPEVDLSDPRLRLAGGPTVLVEFPFMSVPPGAARALERIALAGYQPLLAHPERYEGMDRGLDAVRGWLDAGAFLQVNAGSLVGRYGSAAQDRAVSLVARGWVHCVASDYHARGAPDLRAGREVAERRFGEEPARLLFDVNPARLVRGEKPVLVSPPPRRPSALQRLLDRLSRG